MRQHRDRGALSLEYVLTAPLILAVFGLIFAFGLIAETNGVLDAGTRDAAPAASRSKD
ncbi:MAG: TadE/TadG family type IV pilus assembly protein [Jatrophihabitans sp.]|uniref:TadE/TadG family type IV pilus assembly protein n=1 Tax=Jatrophihabitans sp. TaxID=1932789 RepID=UPI003F7FF733